MIWPPILFFVTSGIILIYFRGASPLLVFFALLFFAVVPSIAMLIWCLLAPQRAEREYIRAMGWSEEQAAEYRRDLHGAANPRIQKAKRQRALDSQRVNHWQQSVTK